MFLCQRKEFINCDHFNMNILELNNSLSETIFQKKIYSVSEKHSVNHNSKWAINSVFFNGKLQNSQINKSILLHWYLNSEIWKRIFFWLTTFNDNMKPYYLKENWHIKFI